MLAHVKRCWIIEVGHPASQAVVVQQTGVPKMHLRGKCNLQLSHMEIKVPWNWCQKTFHFDCREQMEFRGIFSPHSLGNCEGIGKLVSTALGKYFGLFLWKMFFDCTANYCYQRLSTVWCTEGPEMQIRDRWLLGRPGEYKPRIDDCLDVKRPGRQGCTHRRAGQDEDPGWLRCTQDSSALTAESMPEVLFHQCPKN